MLSPRQAMNRSFDPLHLVNTYGAFGSVGRERYEVVLEGTDDADPGRATRAGSSTSSRASPATSERRPAWSRPTTPARLADVVRGDVELRARAVARASRLQAAAGRRGALSLLANNPFPEGAPKWLRAELFEYKLTTFKDRDAGPADAPADRDLPAAGLAGYGGAA